MNRSIKPIYFIFSLLLMMLCACQSESKVFEGEWVDSREPASVWSISKRGSKFIGKRISGEDFYDYEREEWSFEIGEGGFPTLKPINKEGSTVIFQAKQNRILRSPPGRTYVKSSKEK